MYLNRQPTRKVRNTAIFVQPVIEYSHVWQTYTFIVKITSMYEYSTVRILNTQKLQSNL